MKKQTKLSPLACGIALFLALAACKKEEKSPDPVTIDLPETVTLDYGSEKKLDVSESLSGRSGVSLKVSFGRTPNVNIAATGSLHDKLSQAVSVEKNEVRIDSKLLYPNGAVSVADGTAIPDDYQLTVTAQAADGTVLGERAVSVKVTPGSISIKEAENKEEYPFAFTLYKKEETRFELESPTIPTSGTTWHLPAISGETSVSLDGNLIKFAGVADGLLPSQQPEKVYDLEPELLKDGFPIASTKFKVTFIPEVQFFWGMYWPEDGYRIFFPIVHYSRAGDVRTSAPVFFPTEYKSTFAIVKMERLAPPYDGSFVPFDDTDGIFGIVEDTGQITVKKNTTLAPGHYRATVKAISSVGLEFTTEFTLGLES